MSHKLVQLEDFEVQTFLFRSSPLLTLQDADPHYVFELMKLIGSVEGMSIVQAGPHMPLNPTLDTTLTKWRICSCHDQLVLDRSSLLALYSLSESLMSACCKVDHLAMLYATS